MKHSVVTQLRASEGGQLVVRGALFTVEHLPVSGSVLDSQVQSE